jgi:predicted RNA binding protein YcfA (HicA-like mRNA interferase family)
MAKLPVVRGRDLYKILLKLGFEKHHQVGSHIQMKHPDGRRTTIPYHPSQEIRKGTLKAILDDIELTPEEFLKAK